DRRRLSHALLALLAGNVRPRRPRRAGAATGRGRGRHPPRLQPRARRFRAMSVYLGIDIGTFESKGVLVDGSGRILASAARPHKLIVPQSGWAEHRPREDWWGDFCFLANRLIADSGL